MNLAAVIFTVLTSIYLLRASRAWAPLPLLIGASYMTLGQQLLIGPFHFSVIRILIAVGVARVVLRGERLCAGWKRLDSTMLVWGIWAIVSSGFHKDVSATLVSDLGLVYDSFGMYFLLRVFLEDVDGVSRMAKFVVILLTPIAIEMIVEHFSGRNAFAVFGGVPEACEVRGGRIRAQGPFLHSILAGTVGAVCWPLAFSLWRENRRLSLIGLAAALAIVLTSSSSGPIMTSLFGIMGLCWWRFRRHTRLLRWGALAALFGLNMVMNAPVYYLIAKIDLTGNSTGWHRSALIGASIKHFDEWWLGGTDYTRHWMPTGVQWSQNHTDITNHYIKMGVIGGLPLMLLFICVLQCAFSAVGRVVDANEAASAEERFRVWTLGAVLFAHAATFFSVSYFDQSVVFLYLVLAAIGSLSLAQPAEQHPGTESDVVVAVENETPFCHNC